MTTFDFKEIFHAAFGYSAPRRFEIGNVSKNSNQEGDQQFEIEKAPEKRTHTIGKGQQLFETDSFGREFFLPVWLNEQLIPFAVMSMTWKKTFVTTPMVERQGGVHELISIDDYVFNIKGLLIDDDGEFPESEIIKMHDLFKINANVRLRSALSAIVLKGEERVIIKEIKWPVTAGVEHVKAFEIDCESDQIFTLDL